MTKKRVFNGFFFSFDELYFWEGEEKIAESYAREEFFGGKLADEFDL